MPFLVHSTNTSEQPIIAQIHFTQENTTAFITYEIEINGEKQTFTTQITVGPKLPQEEKPADTTLIMIIIGVCIIVVIGYMIYSHIKYRRR
jgi:heme/copper-type cytochrome/quinol oxidase subunit 2